MKEYNIQIKGIELTVYQNDDGLFEIPTLIKSLQKVGTSLKHAYEPIIVARKPCEGSTTDNVIKYGVGGINIDECRIGVEQRTYKGMSSKKPDGAGCFRDDNWQPKDIENTVNGRFPSNLILTYDETDKEEVCGGFPEGGKNGSVSHPYKMNNQVYGDYGYCNTWEAYDDSGSASRYFKNCEYNIRDDDIWKPLLVNNVENNFKILRATRDSIAQMNVEGLLKELLDRYAKSA